jgi:hypothetical protein
MLTFEMEMRATLECGTEPPMEHKAKFILQVDLTVVPS